MKKSIIITMQALAKRLPAGSRYGVPGPRVEAGKASVAETKKATTSAVEYSGRAGAAGSAAIGAAPAAGVNCQASAVLATRTSSPPPGNHGWDAIASALNAEAGMPNIPKRVQS